MWQNLCRMRLKWYYFSKTSFHLISEVFFAKNQKIFQVGKIGIYDEETVFLQNKRFHLLKRLRYQNGKP